MIVVALSFLCKVTLFIPLESINSKLTPQWPVHPRHWHSHIKHRERISHGFQTTWPCRGMIIIKVWFFQRPVARGAHTPSGSKPNWGAWNLPPLVTFFLWSHWTFQCVRTTQHAHSKLTTTIKARNYDFFTSSLERVSKLFCRVLRRIGWPQ